MTRGRLRRLPTLLALTVLALAAGVTSAGASTPASGSLSWSHTTQTWGQTGMSGSAYTQTATVCPAEPTACDDFTFTLDSKKNGAADPSAQMRITVVASATALMDAFVYAPGCPIGSGTCRAAIGLDGTFIKPADGKWAVRVHCQACPPGSSYTASAKLSDTPPPKVPAPGDQSFHWKVQQLAAKDNTAANAAYGEPGMWINRKGYGIVNSFGPTLWITTDDGRTWSKPAYNLGTQDTTCLFGSGDADGVVGEDGTFYVENLCIGNAGGSSGDMFANRDGGKTSKWTGPSYGGMNVDRQWVTPDPKQAGTAYLEYHDLEGPNINVLKTTDYGATWTCPLTGVPGAGPCPVTATANSNTGFIDTGLGNTTARLLVDPTDPQRLYVAYADNCAVNSAATPPTSPDFDLTRIHVAVSTDGGGTWAGNTAADHTTPAFDANAAFGGAACQTAPPSAPDLCGNRISHTFPTAAIDEGGNLYVVFSMKKCNDTQTHLWLISSTDHGATWSKPSQVDRGGLGSNIFEWVIGGSDGRIGVTWYGSPAKDFNDTSAQWSEMYAVSTNATSAHPSFVQSNITPGHSMHNADICEAGTLCLATGGNRDLADFQMVAIGADGYAQAVWTDDSTGTGVTMVARQTSGPKLVVMAAATNSGVLGVSQNPFTRGLGYLSGGAWIGALLGVLGLALAAGGAIAWRRRRT